MCVFTAVCVCVCSRCVFTVCVHCCVCVCVHCCVCSLLCVCVCSLLCVCVCSRCVFTAVCVCVHCCVCVCSLLCVFTAVCVCVCVCVCVKCRAQILSMSHHTWPYVTSLIFFLLLLINFTPEFKFYTIHYNSTIFYTISSNYITKYYYNAFNILTITIIFIIIHYIYNTQFISLVN